MLSFLRSLSAVLFYILGASFMLAVVFMQAGMFGLWPAWWMQVAELPLLLTGMMFGGLSLYISIRGPGAFSTVMAGIMTVVMMAFFGVMVGVNFLY